MSQTEEFIQRLQKLKHGELSRLRRLAGQPLDHTLQGFDLFTGLWWPLRQKSPRTPQREPSWLVTKLYAAFPLQHMRPNGAFLPVLLGSHEPLEEFGRKRFRRRFNTLLNSPLSGLEPHLRWALSVVADSVAPRGTTGLDWVQLLDDLSIWDRGAEHRCARDVREIWAEMYVDRCPSKREDSAC